MCNIFQFVFIDQDRDKVRLDAERGDECVREFFCDFAFLVGGKAFSQIQYNNRHKDIFCMKSLHVLE